MKILKRIMIIPVLPVLCCISGYLLLVATYCIPVSRINSNMERSAELFKQEGTYPKTNLNVNSQQDNFTDAKMLLIAAYPAGNPWTCAIDALNYGGGGQPCRRFN